MAKKSRGFNELLYQERWNKASSESCKKLEKAIKKDSDNEVKIVKNDPNIAKMSDVLKEFAHPYVKAAKNKKQLQHLYGTVVAAWNLAIIPEEERISILDEIFLQEVENLGAEDAVIGKAVIESLIQRKQKYFADNNRTVLDFQLTYLGQDEYHLAVMSSPPK